MHAKNKDTQLIWEAYDSKLTNETMKPKTSEMTEREKFKLAALAAKSGKGPLAKPKDKQRGRMYDTEEIKNEGNGEEMELDTLVYKGAEHFEKFRGKADHDEIFSHLEAHFQQFFESNYDRFSNAEQVISYIESGGFRQDLKDEMGLSHMDDSDMFDQVFDDM